MLLGIISVDFEVIDQLLKIYSTFAAYWRKNGVQWDSPLAIYIFQESL
jgi:hypothetical protein